MIKAWPSLKPEIMHELGRGESAPLALKLICDINNTAATHRSKVTCNSLKHCAIYSYDIYLIVHKELLLKCIFIITLIIFARHQ